MIHILSGLAIILIVAGLIITFWKRVFLTHTLLIVNVIIFLLKSVTPEMSTDLALRPEYIFTGEKIYTVITSMYMHVDVMHLIFNMIFLIFIGLSLEEKIGTGRYGVIFYSTGVIAVVTYSFTSGLIRSEVLVMGASGGLYGILGAYARLYPNEKFAFLPFPYPMPIFTWAFIFILIAIVATFVPDICFGGNIAHIAHVGGFFGGLAISPLVMKIKGKETEKKVTTLNFEALESLAQSDEEKELLKKIKSEDEPEVRDAWLEHFLEKARCPHCGNILEVKGRGIRCTCGFELKF